MGDDGANMTSEITKLRRVKGSVGAPGSGSRSLRHPNGVQIVSNSRRITTDVWALPLHPPEGLCVLETAEGQCMLQEAETTAAFDRLWPYFVPQAGSSCCGVCSTSIVYSALQRRWINEDDTFALLPVELMLSGKSAEATVRERGVTLEQLASIVDSLPGIKTTQPCVHGDHLSVDDTRAMLRRALASVPPLTDDDAAVADETYVLYNYQMSELGETPWAGHVSPIAAYHEPSDSFLVLDCWFHTMPVWATTARLHYAMSASMDSISQKKRGVVLVSRDGDSMSSL